MLVQFVGFSVIPSPESQTQATGSTPFSHPYVYMYSFTYKYIYIYTSIHLCFIYIYIYTCVLQKRGRWFSINQISISWADGLVSKLFSYWFWRGYEDSISSSVQVEGIVLDDDTAIFTPGVLPEGPVGSVSCWHRLRDIRRKLKHALIVILFCMTYILNPIPEYSRRLKYECGHYDSSKNYKDKHAYSYQCVLHRQRRPRHRDDSSGGAGNHNDIDLVLQPPRHQSSTAVSTPRFKY